AVASFDHLAGDREKLVWYGETQRSGGLEIDRQLEPSRLFDGQLRWLGTLQNSMRVPSRAPKQVPDRCTIRHQSTSTHGLVRLVYGGQAVPYHEINNLVHVQQYEIVIGGGKCVRLSPHHCRKCPFKIATFPHRNGNQLQSQGRDSDNQFFQE